MIAPEDHMGLVTQASRRFGAWDEDAIAEGVLGLVQSARSYRGGATFSTWAVPRIRGRMIDHYRRERRRAVVALSPALPAPGSVEDETLGRIDIERGLARLDAAELEVIRGYFVEGLKLHEIGTLLGVSESRACQIKRRALNRMRSP